MARVCCSWFPKGTYKGQKQDGFYMDDVLKDNLDALLKNAGEKDDWDFVLVISGGGQVRVGKSVLALQIACYWHYEQERLYGKKLPFTVKDNIVFDGRRLIKQGNKLGTTHPHSALIFDEAGADLEGAKAMRRTTQNVKDYLRECGQYNMLTILVLPEFFDLPKGIALSRSDFLLDCYVWADSKGKFQRGFFNGYSRPNKKHLYLKGKKELNYKAYRYDFHGRWFLFYPIDEEEYRKEKVKALRQREVLSAREERRLNYLRGSFKILTEMGLTQRDIAEKIRKYTGMITSHRYIGRLLGKEKDEEEELD